MTTYTTSELENAKGTIESSVRKIEKVLDTLLKKDPLPKAQITLAKRNLKALRLTLSLIDEKIEELNV